MKKKFSLSIVLLLLTLSLFGQNTYNFNIEGETTVCLGETYTYTASGLSNVNWYVQGGTVVDYPLTNQIVVTWTSDQGSITAESIVSYEVCDEPCLEEPCEMVISGCYTVTDYYYSNPFTIARLMPSIINSANTNSVCTGTTVTLTANPLGLQYQWKRDGAIISAATQPIFNPAQSGNYSVVVTNGICSIESPITALSILPIPVKPSISTSTSQIAPGSTYLTSSTGNSFIWYKNGLALTGSTTLNPYLASSSGSYTVANTNGACSTLSDPVNVTTTNIKSYEITNSVNIPGITTEAQLRVQTPGSGAISQSIVYLDDLGRPLQEIATANSPLGKDMLFHHEYNDIGFESKRYLPFVVAQSNGIYYANPVGTSSYINSPHYLFYNDSGSDPTKKIPDDTNPFIQTVLEKSPLARVLEQGGTGSLYQPDLNTPSNGKTTKLAYASNAVNEVFKWAITDNGNLNYSLTRTYYPANVLNVTITTDAHGLQTKTYTNSYGQTIMSRLQRDGSTWADTYYVYDGYGNLRFILPPEAINQININEFSEIGTLPGDVTSGISSITLTSPGNGNQYIYETTATITLGNGFSSSPGFEVRPFHKRNATLLNRYAYQYVYDNLNRKIAEKGPENDWSYFIFDKYNRLVLSQNPNQRATNEWSFTKYDLWDRPVLSGATTIAGSVETIRQAVANSTVMYESRGSVVHGYTNNAYPNVSDENSYLIITYYDDYSFKSLINEVTAFHYKNNDLPGQPVSEYTRIKGSNTGSKTRVIGQNSWLWSVAYYDDRGRSIQTISANHKGGTDRVSMLYNFSGKVLSTKHSHAWESKSYSVRNDFEYDNAGRLLRKYHQIGEDPGTRVLLNAFEYNELGQLITRKLHSTNGGSNFLQTVQVRSNIQGELLSQISEDFELGLGYENNLGISGVIPSYRGEVTSVSWMNNMKYTAPVTNKEQAWSFTYDGISQLQNSNYWERTKGSTSWGSALTRLTETGISYDFNGNIETLTRKDVIGANMDNLIYNYGAGDSRGNRLVSVTDNGDVTKGFKDGNVGQDYFYDAYGNLTKDLNKNITQITYNKLNLTERIQMGSGSYMQYTYNASGAKLSEALYSAGGSLLKRLDYIGPFVYEENPVIGQPSTLQFIMHEEGRVLPVPNNASWEYQYIVRDHVGNARIMLSAAPRYKEYKTTLESENATQEESNFLNLPGTRFINLLANNTPGGNEVAILSNTSPVGPAISLQVMPGDAVDARVYVYHEGTGFGTSSIAEGSLITSIAGAFGGVSGLAGEAGQIFSGVQNAVGLYGPGANPSNNHPAAYINYLVFDLDMVPVTGGYVRVGNGPGTTVMAPILIDKPGFVFLYLSNEGNASTPVYFDDFIVQHQESKMAGVYLNYPFGAEITSHTVERHRMPENMYRYQGKRLEKELGIELYDFNARLYDPFLGRWFAIDPMGQFASPYNAMGNNPVMSVDPDGRLAHVIVGAVLGALVNGSIAWANHENIGKAALKGAIIGGAAAGTGGLAGGAVSSALGGTGFLAGAAVGAASGFAGGFTSGSLNTWLNDGSFKDGISSGLESGAYGALSGGVIRGLSGGITSVRHGGNFWSGKGATFASFATSDPIAGDPLEYSTEKAEEYGKYFKDLKYHDKVTLTADGSYDSKLFKSDGDFFEFKSGKYVGKQAYAYTQLRGIGKGADIVFAKASFYSARQLYLVMGHEYIHAGFLLMQIPGYGPGETETQHASIYRWEQEVSKKWGGWNPNTDTHLFKNYFKPEYNHTRFFKLQIPWID